MTPRELGLVLAQQLLDVEDLHYGLWAPDLEVSPGNLIEAQQRYSTRLLDEWLTGPGRRFHRSVSAWALPA